MLPPFPTACIQSRDSDCRARRLRQSMKEFIEIPQLRQTLQRFIDLADPDILEYLLQHMCPDVD